jgi:hypothetical protein
MHVARHMRRTDTFLIVHSPFCINLQSQHQLFMEEQPNVSSYMKRNKIKGINGVGSKQRGISISATADGYKLSMHSNPSRASLAPDAVDDDDNDDADDDDDDDDDESR